MSASIIDTIFDTVLELVSKPVLKIAQDILGSLVSGIKSLFSSEKKPQEPATSHEEGLSLGDVLGKNPAQTPGVGTNFAQNILSERHHLAQNQL